MAANPQAQFLSLVHNPIKFKLFLLQKLPAAFFAGVKIKAASMQSCTAVVPYKWATQNPFRSTYFACLGMAAEMSTGILAMAHLYKRTPPVSMLVSNIEGAFHKKATGKTYFTCNDGALMQQAIEQSVQTGQGQAIKVYTRGENEAGELVAEFWVTWSFKPKQQPK